jgi:Zn-finger nucleic acid-binding protein
MAAMQAQTLNCSACGAAVATDSPVCQHCGARLATLACPSCFGMMYRGSKFCPHCGAPAVTWAATPDAKLCPGCRQPLFRGQLGGSTLHQCGKCFGFWVDRTTFERICREAEQQAVLPEVAEPAAAPASAVLPAIRYVRCPECRSLMNRVNFAEYSGVVVDVCREHGTWFDAQELQRIVQFIRAGGMDKARERKKADWATERRRLEAARQWSDGESNLPVAGSSVDPRGVHDVVRAINALLGRRPEG